MNIIRKKPFILSEHRKKEFFTNEINRLTKHHFTHSKNYKKILNGLNYNSKINDLENLPFLTTNLFKELKLISIKESDIFKTLSSSGTSGTKRSKIYLDKDNAYSQRVILKQIFEHYFGSQRLPMLFISKNPNINRERFDAKTAAILGFSIFGTNHTYLLRQDNSVDEKVLENFLNKYSNKKFLIFGFTFEVFNSFFNRNQKLEKINLENATLIHGGGWKKMKKNKVSNDDFKQKFLSKYSLKNIYNYYGLIEQIGSIFFECPKCNLFVCSDFSEILIRDKNLKILKKGKGLIQLFSLLPKSYPGHNILTEDIGEIITDGCCNHKGKVFKVYGRVHEAETRGCSDV